MKLKKVKAKTILRIEELIDIANQYRPNVNTNFFLEFVVALRNIEEKLVALQLLGKMKKDDFTRVISSLSKDARHSLIANPFQALGFDEFCLLALYALPVFNGRERAEFANHCPSLLFAQDTRLGHAIERLKNDKSLEDLAADVSAILASHLPITIDELCPFLIHKKAWKSLVDLCLGYVSIMDSFLHEASMTDLDDSRRRIFVHIFNNIDHCLQFAMKSEDEFFCRCLYKFLLQSEHTLSRIRHTKSSQLKPFLKESHPQELWLYYQNKGRYLTAAHHLVDLTFLDDFNVFLEERIALLEQAAALSFECNELKVFVSMKLETAQIQLKYAKRRRSGPDCDDFFNTIIFEEQDLYIECLDQRFWDLIIRLFSYVQIKSSSTENVISVAWRNLLGCQFFELTLSEIRIRLIELLLMTQIDGLFEVVMQVEEFRMNRRANPQWAVDIFLSSKLPLHRLIQSYSQALECPLSKKCRIEFIFCLSILIQHGAVCDTTSYKTWFMNNAANEPYFEQVMLTL
jgi:hypothetical protein